MGDITKSYSHKYSNNFIGALLKNKVCIKIQMNIMVSCKVRPFKGI